MPEVPLHYELGGWSVQLPPPLALVHPIALAVDAASSSGASSGRSAIVLIKITNLSGPMPQGVTPGMEVQYKPTARITGTDNGPHIELLAHGLSCYMASHLPVEEDLFRIHYPANSAVSTNRQQPAISK